MFWRAIKKLPQPHRQRQKSWQWASMQNAAQIQLSDIRDSPKYCAVNVGSKTHRVPSGIFEHYNCWGTENIECHLESLDITKRLLAVSGLGTPALVYCPTYDIMSCNCCRGSLHYCPTYDIMSCNCCRASASAPSC